MFNPEDFFNSLPEADKESCWDSIGAYGEDADEPSIIVLQISEDSLVAKDFDDAEMLEFSDLGYWDSLEGVLPEGEIEKHKVDFEGVSSYVVLLYCNGAYVTSAQGD